MGLRNLVWRTPGSDEGRDIEGVAYHRDLSGHELPQKWYVECKRYATSIDWPTIWQKIAYADVQGADILLISTNSNPSPQCESQVAKWNSRRRRPVVRFWRGYELPHIVRPHRHIVAAYGLESSRAADDTGALSLALIITRITQAAFVAGSFAMSNNRALEAASSICELLSQRLDDLTRYGRFVPSPTARGVSDLDWAIVDGSTISWDDVGLRAIVATIRYQFDAKTLHVKVEGRQATITLGEPKLRLAGRTLEDLTTVAHWARVEIAAGGHEPVELTVRQRE